MHRIGWKHPGVNIFFFLCGNLLGVLGGTRTVPRFSPTCCGSLTYRPCHSLCARVPTALAATVPRTRRRVLLNERCNHPASHAAAPPEHAHLPPFPPPAPKARSLTRPEFLLFHFVLRCFVQRFLLTPSNPYLHPTFSNSFSSS
ncbi:hypothetical protein VTO42DRAFT_125 [Malbranchea cinnamomea]